VAGRGIPSILLLGVAAALAGCGTGQSSATAQSSSRSATAARLAAQVKEARLVTPAVGWVLTSPALLLTHDGGRTWNDITPPGVPAWNLTSVEFLDARHGWAAFIEGSAGGQSVGVATTTDGGATWSATQVVHASTATSRTTHLSVADASDGWLAVQHESGSALAVGTLYRTDDGGRTWRSATPPAGGDVSAEHTTDGVVVDDRASGLPAWQTTDGGGTWAKIALTGPAGFADASGFAAPPTWTADGGVMPVTFTSEGRSVVQFVTGAPGGDWRPRATIATGLGGGAMQPTSILADGTWIVLPASGGPLDKLTNGGASVSTTTPHGLALHGGAVDDVSFADEDHGWAVVVGTTSGARLYATADGGSAWRRLVLPPAAAGG
jgi:hypothetical protein